MRTKLCLLLLWSGVVMVAVGLWSPLVWLPVIYDIRYTDMTYLGGTGDAIMIVALMAAASVMQVSTRHQLRSIAWFCAGGAVALVAGTMWDICRWASDKVQDLGGEALLAQLQYRKGTLLVGLGMTLWLLGSVRQMLREQK
mgnify:CR=1 FL=1